MKDDQPDTFPFSIRTFDWSNAQATRDRRLADASPALAVLATAPDDVEAWMKAGQAWSRVLTSVAVTGVPASFLNQPIEVADLRPRVQALLPRALTPQLVARFGYVHPSKPTPRRAGEDVLL